MIQSIVGNALTEQLSSGLPTENGALPIAGRYDLDRILERPYEEGLLLGFSELLFAFYSPGWGFEPESIFRTGLERGYGLPVQIFVDGTPLSPQKAVYRPSCVRSEAESGGVRMVGYKMLTREDLAAVILTVANTGASRPIRVEVFAEPWCIAPTVSDGMTVSAQGWQFRAEGGRLCRRFMLPPGRKAVCKLAMAFSDSAEENARRLSAFFAEPDSVGRQSRALNAWFLDNIPYFECDSRAITEIYYFRWLTYRSNIRKTPADRYMITEFLPNVSWAGKYNSISAAAYMHFMEGRWIADRRYLQDYEDFWFEEGAAPRLYSFPVASACYQHFLVSGDRTKLTGLHDRLEENHAAWIAEKRRDNGLYFQLADRDGMEYAPGGDGFRPTINSYMYGDAVALSKIAAMAGRPKETAAYAAEAARLKRLVQDRLWNRDDGFFEVLHEQGETAGVRELSGYVPWVFQLPDDAYAGAFAQLLDPEGFDAPFGPTTVEQRSPDFMQAVDHDCLWNGPSWPYATTQTLWAAANLLNGPAQPYLNKEAYCRLLEGYARSQYRDGRPWIAENLHPRTGEWIVDKKRSVHYNHSCFADLVITGYVGLRPEDSSTLTIHPLASDKTDYFALENAAYRGHRVSVYYDRVGDRYGLGAGLHVFVDQHYVMHSPVLDAVTVSIE